MNRFIKIIITLIIVILVSLIGLVIYSNNALELVTISSEKELLNIYNGDDYHNSQEIAARILTMPFSFLADIPYTRYTGMQYKNLNSVDYISDSLPSRIGVTATESTATGTTVSEASRDYSTTNIQVENVDEADIIKTDGDYIYSISDSKVIITNVKDPQDIKIEATIELSSLVPEDIMLYKDKLVVISANASYSSYTYYYSRDNNTNVKIYDISTKSNPKVVKSFELDKQYYTSRCIDNKLYVIASGYLEKENDKILHNYIEDNISKEIPLNNIKYLKGVDNNTQTIISVTDLDNLNANISVSSYLIDISNCYVSENAIYLLDYQYDYGPDLPSIWKIFGPRGIWGLFDDDYFDYDYDSGYYTTIYKFDIKSNGDIKYSAKSKLEGRTINQYSLDEKDNHLRIALYDYDGTRVVILDEKLNLIGETVRLAKGEQMYSSRFIDNKAYLVTYRTTDPLFVIDLSNEENPKVLGELHIPGYSTYLHPYDENHLIGIGMETEEYVNRDSSGRVLSTTAILKGMKMALFDVSDVNNPKQISQTLIGDKRTTSAILTNPKALLFSKEKELIAIPVNNLDSDFEVATDEDLDYDTLIDSYKNNTSSYVSEGYLVYKINIKDGFNLKGVITHENNKVDNYFYKYRNYYNSKLLRGLYIDNNLYTVSEDMIKVNNLDTLDLVSELKID